MDRSERIRLARRRARLSQTELASRVGVKRSAVANWESPGGANPTSGNLARLACTLVVAHEWLATGRGEMAIRGAESTRPSPVIEPGTTPVERRLLKAWRGLPPKPQLAMLELVEAYRA